MTVEMDGKIMFFRTREIWFSDHPYEVDNCASVSFRECKKKIDAVGFTRTEFTTLIIDLTQKLDDIWDEMGAKSCRYKITRALREGIQAELGQEHGQFYELNRIFRRQKGLPGKTLTLLQMQQFGTLFVARREDEVIAGQLYLEDKDNIRYLLGASKRLATDQKTAALIGFGNRLLVWEAMKYAKSKGIKEFDLGGFYTGAEVCSPKHGINAFKKSFGGKIDIHYNYKKYYSPPYKLLRNLYWLGQRNGV